MTGQHKGRIEISTSEFQFAHGRKPRGRGHWAFYLPDDPEPVFFNGTYTEACRLAKALAAARFPGRYLTIKLGS